MRRFNLSIFIMLLILGLMNQYSSLASSEEKESEYDHNNIRRTSLNSELQPSLSEEEKIKIQVRRYCENLIPVGTINAYAGIAEPEGWLFCYGQALNRVTFGNLYRAIGTMYGDGDGISTFNIPDLRGRVIVGVDKNAGRVTSNNTLGKSSGEEKHQLTVDELPSHNHTMGYIEHGITTGGHPCHDVSNALNSKFLTKNTGNNHSHNNMQPYLVLNYIIKY